ncbi:MAG: DHH family phosphoesterase [Oscillospiraceae bacterium]|nr:DHH family phosphoesterase [Oscillospiraceae bacterium]
MNKRLGRRLWPSVGLFFALLAAFAVAAILFEYYLLAVIEFVVIALVLVLYIINRNYRRQELQRYIHKSLENITAADGSQPPFPMVTIRLEDNVIVYANDEFTHLTGYRDFMKDRMVSEVLPGFSTDWMAEGKTQYPYDVKLQRRRYRVYGTTIFANDPKATRLGVLYLTDLTELYQVRDEYIRSRPIVSIILVDNYEELTKNLSEGAISGLHAKINDVITEWTSQYGGLLRRLEKNRFLLIFEKRDLKHMIDNKFSLLEQVHEITSPSGLPASISFGLGVDAESYEEGYEFAALSIEMALSRGGDQAVVKDWLNFNFYGGRNKEADHRSKVRSRITAGSLMELIGQSSQVFIMGHKNADLDAVGAAVGVRCLCRKKGKEAHIVLDMEENAAARLIEQLVEVPEYQNAFISAQEALVRCDNRSLLVVVDTNRPDQVESKHLLEAITSVCVIDHHRRAADYITPVVVNLHEPYASSASELVTELMQYAVEKKDVLPIEAKSLMAGIFLDTKSFNVRTGERTFEAAAYLRQLGADTVEVKKLLQNDFQDTMAKYQIIKSARLYRQEIAIAALNAGTSRALAAQAADELLNISGISASFVLYPDEDRVFISARSIGEANVQMILEPLGGGGNTATAGAQLKDTTVKDALDALVQSIDKYYDDDKGETAV